MITKLGIFTLSAGLLVGLFSGISQFMASRTLWVDLTISKIIGQENSETIVLLTDIEAVQNFFDYIIYDLLFFCFLIGIGIILLIISLFMKTH
ncbi:MAG: hypothetical protein ABFR31_07140 [Thermodesulfobacteriota bacterium]